VYRYLLSAKVLSQLEEFKIQPNYECLCRSLFKYAKKPEQLKLLWKTILEKTRGRLECINSSCVGKIWKELCVDKKYSNICQNEEDIMNRVELTLNKYSKKLKTKQLNTSKSETIDNKANKNTYNHTSLKIDYQSPSNNQNNNEKIPQMEYKSPNYNCNQYIICNNNTSNNSYIPLSPPISECSSTISNDGTSNNYSIYFNNINEFKTYKAINIIPNNNVTPNNVIPNNVISNNVIPNSVIPNNVIPNNVIPNNVIIQGCQQQPLINLYTPI
ncbi:hypothetical protein PIROE2DRAFT_18102, partial [Piromyces sp. E2]